MLRLIFAILFEISVEGKICGLSKAVYGRFKHFEHKEAVRENCTYKIILPEGEKIKIIFEKFIECHRASITVLDKNGEYGPFCEGDKRSFYMEELGFYEFSGPEISVNIIPATDTKSILNRLEFTWETGMVIK
jgi:hypothetical protein